MASALRRIGTSADSWPACFPEVRVDPDVLFVDNGRVLTSAGGAAGIDLCLHLIRRDFGAEIAANAARRCVVAPWRDGGQAQFIQHPMPTATESPPPIPGTGYSPIWTLH